MSLADALSSQRTPVSTPCNTGALIDRLPAEDRAVLIAALRLDSGMTHAQIYRALDAEGHKIGQHSIGRHRKGECACEPR